MGFGYLLLGYFMAFAFTLADMYFFFDIVGGALMLVGLSKLSPHGKNFYRAMWADIAYIFLCLGRTVLIMLKMIPADGVWAKAFGFGIAAASLALQFFILAGIYFIALKVDLPKETAHAKRNILYLLLYYFGYIAAMILLPYLGIIGNIASLAITVFGLVILILNLILIHSCYCRICLEGQQSGERTPSRFAFINRFNKKADEVFDNAYLRPKKERKTPSENAEEVEPGYRRVKRKQKSKRK